MGRIQSITNPRDIANRLDAVARSLTYGGESRESEAKFKLHELVSELGGTGLEAAEQIIDITQPHPGDTRLQWAARCVLRRLRGEWDTESVRKMLEAGLGAREADYEGGDAWGASPVNQAEQADHNQRARDRMARMPVYDPRTPKATDSALMLAARSALCHLMAFNTTAGGPTRTIAQQLSTALEQVDNDDREFAEGRLTDMPRFWKLLDKYLNLRDAKGVVTSIQQHEEISKQMAEVGAQMDAICNPF